VIERSIVLSGLLYVVVRTTTDVILVFIRASIEWVVATKGSCDALKDYHQHPS